MTKAAIIGIAGTTLSDDEAALLREQPPAGVILFARNIASPAQLQALTAALRQALPPDALLMVDQEGGRVARLRPPGWGAHPPAGGIGRLFGRDPAAGQRAAWLTGALIGLDCAAAGFDTACAPVLDLGLPQTHAAIGDRAYAADPLAVARLGRAMAAGLLAAGVLPVAKHAPGHGRAEADSHLSLPVVATDDLSADIFPFACNADLPAMMTSHILYRALDPEHPATLSPAIIGGVIRGRIGFAGLLLSDDLAMHALDGPPAARAVGSLAAGCDLAMYCPGDPAGTRAVLAAVPPLTAAGLGRMAAARVLVGRRGIDLDGRRLRAERAELGL